MNTDMLTLYGPWPETDVPVHTTLMHRLDLPGRTLAQWRVDIGPTGTLGWTLFVLAPEGVPRCDVLLSPDGCWPHVLSHEASTAVLDEGVALAWFSRTELAHDGPQAWRAGPVHARWPGVPWSAMAVWAWGLCRSADALVQQMGERLGALGVVGHSRGGKAALLAGAMDPRFAAVIAHNSGTGGAASLQVQGEGAETLAELATRFAHWLAPQAAQAEVQQALVARDAPRAWLQAIAPRGLCILQAHDDAWANPLGTRHMVEQLRPAWRQAPERLRWQERGGGHAMGVQDWRAAARFLREVAAQAHAPPTDNCDSA